MAIMASDNGEGFERELPMAGMQDAVLSKIFDLGQQDSPYGRKHQVLFVWELAETMTEGKFQGNRFVLTQTFTLSLNEKANLRKTIESWRGKQMTEEQARAGVDLEKYLKMPATLNVIHAEKRDGSEFAKVGTVLPPRQDAPMLFPELADDWCPTWVQEKIQAGLVTMNGGPGEVTEKSGTEKEETEKEGAVIF